MPGDPARTRLLALLGAVGIACAARHDEPIAPGYEADATATCGPDDV